MTIEPESKLAKAFRASRRYHGETPRCPSPARRPASLALSLARERLADIAAASDVEQLAREAAELGELSHNEAHAARSRRVDLMARAGLFHTAQSWAPARPGWAPDRSALYPGDWPAFRSVTPAHDIASHLPQGYYDNPHGESARDGSGLVWGVVAALSHGRFLAGWQHGGTDGGPAIATGRGFFDDESDAARYADGLAERAAENERDYQEAWQAGQHWAELGDTIAETRAEALAMLKENRESGGSRDLPAIHATITRAACDAWDRICEARAERAELERFQSYNPDAWAEGAGI